MLNRQHAFTTAIAAIIKQGQPAMNDDGDCLYRGPSNTRCAIGWLIPDDKYRPNWDKSGGVTPDAQTDEAHALREALGANDDDALFLANLQAVHDNAAPSHDFLKDFTASARSFAVRHNLEMPVV